MIVDGDHGPGDPAARRRDARPLSSRRRAASLARFATGGAARPARRITADGVQIDLYRQHRISARGAPLPQPRRRGIGLYRTEFLYLGARNAAGRRSAFSGLFQRRASDGRQPVVIRTFDLGADKVQAKLAGRRREEPVPGTAQHPAGAANLPILSHAAAGHPAGQRAGRRAGHVSADRHAARAAAGEDGAGRRDGRPRRTGREFRSIAICRSA